MKQLQPYAESLYYLIPDVTLVHLYYSAKSKWLYFIYFE